MDFRPWARSVSCIAAALVSFPAARADTIKVRASGTVLGTCTVVLASGFPTSSNLAISGNAQAQATVNCNTGFVIKATSASGAITSTSHTATGFTNTVPYSLAFNSPTDSGIMIGGPCASATLVAGQAGCVLSPAGSGLSSNGALATGKTATLTLSWTPPVQKLVAGTYTDVITLSIAAAP